MDLASFKELLIQEFSMSLKLFQTKSVKFILF